MTDICLTVKGNCATIIGELTRHTLDQLKGNHFTHLFENDSASVNLEQVSKIDTAGLAWLFHLLELAGNTRCQLCFSHIPSKLHKLIELSGVDGFLPLAVE